MSLRDLQQFDGVPMPPEVLAEKARVEQCDALCLVSRSGGTACLR